MKEGYVQKSQEAGEDALALINRYTRRELTAEEVYTFSVVLCDNEIDRDFERFTVGALEKLSHLFVGRTGIFDHQNKSGNQTARIYACRVERPEGRVTGAGEPYARLVAEAYLPRGGKNEELILALDAGIKKEVSVGCSVGSVRCSICGEEVKAKACSHQKGKRYGGVLCSYVLDEPTDAYEWSFVAVPAQREAGVVKHHRPQGEPGAFGAGGEEADELRRKIRELEERARAGDDYRAGLQREVVRLSGLLQPELALSVMEGVAGRMSLEELKAFHKAFSRKARAVLPVVPQLSQSKRQAEEAESPFFI